MVCLHTCLQFICAEAKLVMRGYYTAEKTSYLPPPLLSSPLPLSLSFYDNIAGKWCPPCGGLSIDLEVNDLSVHTGAAGFDPGIFQVWTSSKTSARRRTLGLFPFLGLHIYGTVQHTSFQTYLSTLICFLFFLSSVSCILKFGFY